MQDNNKGVSRSSDSGNRIGITNFINIGSNSKVKMSPDGDFFQAWAEVLRPIHKLAKRETAILAAFLKKRYELSKVIIDPDLLDRTLMSQETKRAIREEYNVSSKYIQVIMSKFRKNGVIKNNKLYQTLIPKVTDEGVGLMIYFNFKDEPLIKLGPQARSQRNEP